MAQCTVVCEVELKEGWEAGMDDLVAATKADAGFVSAQWINEGTTGICVATYESADAAHAAWDGAEIPPEAPVAMRGVKFYDVVATA